MIVIENLTKKYKKIIALDNLSLHVEAGEFFGYLGPNGAGKTTTVKILTSLAKPGNGTAKIGGYDISITPLEAKKLTGVVPQAINLDMELSARENLIIHGRLYGLRQAFIKKQIEKWLTFVGLVPHALRPVRTFSGGMKRRLMIARALLHAPKVLFMDEPTVGLDASGRRDLWGLLKRINKKGATIFLTTHYIEEAEALCDRVGILDHGRLIALDQPKALIASSGKVVVDVYGEAGLQSHFFQDRDTAGTFAASIQGMATLRDANLEDVFVKLTGRRVTS
jgi:ABC-2 type transport system ATP-binding protein